MAHVGRQLFTDTQIRFSARTGVLLILKSLMVVVTAVIRKVNHLAIALFRACAASRPRATRTAWVRPSRLLVRSLASRGRLGTLSAFRVSNSLLIELWVFLLKRGDLNTHVLGIHIYWFVNAKVHLRRFKYKVGSLLGNYWPIEILSAQTANLLPHRRGVPLGLVSNGLHLVTDHLLVNLELLFVTENLHALSGIFIGHDLRFLNRGIHLAWDDVWLTSFTKIMRDINLGVGVIDANGLVNEILVTYFVDHFRL